MEQHWPCGHVSDDPDALWEFCPKHGMACPNDPAPRVWPSSLITLTDAQVKAITAPMAGLFNPKATVK